MEAPLRAIEAHLGETVDSDDFLTWSEWALARVGFRPSNCLALVSVCRDELMSGVDEGIESVWGRAFQTGSLAGMVLAGRSGLSAALGHVPGEDGRHRFVAFCLPHIGVDADGVVGRVQRRGMYRASSACGALIGVRDALLAGAPHSGLDPDDVEFSLLRARIAESIAGHADSRTPSLPELTEIARRSAVEDLRRFIELAQQAEPVDVAYISGIVVHMPDGSDRLARVEAEVVIDGAAMRLPH